MLRINLYKVRIVRIRLYIVKPDKYWVQHTEFKARSSFSTEAFLPRQQQQRMTLCVQHRMIRRPDHSPRIDVEQGTPRSRAIRRVARSVFKASLFVCLHVMGNSPMITRRNKRQTPENVCDGYNPQLWIWPWQIQHLGLYLCCALPPREGLSWAVILSCTA